MRSLSVHPKYFKCFFQFFFFQYKKEKKPSQTTTKIFKKHRVIQYLFQTGLNTKSSTFSPDSENEYKRLGNKSKMSHSSAPSKIYIMIKEFKDELKGLKNILNKIRKLKLLGEQEINVIKHETKIKLNMLDG